MLIVSFSLMSASKQAIAQEAKHFFILSGQSNMAGLKPEESFLPTVEAAFGKNKVIVVKDAMGAQPIRRWYKDWKPMQGEMPTDLPDLYDSLMKKVHAAIKSQSIASVTFIWMQGEPMQENNLAMYMKEAFWDYINNFQLTYIEKISISS